MGRCSSLELTGLWKRKTMLYFVTILVGHIDVPIADFAEMEEAIAAAKRIYQCFKPKVTFSENQVPVWPEKES